MATQVDIQLGYKNVAWFAANPTFVLKSGQHVHLSDGAGEFIEAYVIGDGVTELDDLPWRGLKVRKVVGEQQVISGTTATLDNVPLSGTYAGYIQSQRAGIGIGYFILSVIGDTVTFSEDRTGELLISDYEY